MKTKKIIIIGDSSFAQIAYEYFQHDSVYEVVGFTVESDFLKNTTLMNLPVVPFERLPEIFPVADHEFYAALVYTKLNRLRTRLYEKAKKIGYKPASYISSKSFIWPNCEIGEHCFIFENNIVQPFVKIGNNNVLWSGNHVGHHSEIGDNCFIASHVVISGHTVIGDNCFLGVNSTLSNNLTIGKDCIIGAGAIVTKDMNENKISKPLASEIRDNARRLSKADSF